MHCKPTLKSWNLRPFNTCDFLISILVLSLISGSYKCWWFSCPVQVALSYILPLYAVKISTTCTSWLTIKNFGSIFFRRKLHIRGLTFDELLHSIVGFNNQGNVSFLLDTLKLDETSSYMRGLHKYVVISAFICETISITPILYMGAKYDGGLLYHYEKDYDYFLKIMAFFFFCFKTLNLWIIYIAHL